MEGEREATDLLVLPSRLGLGVYISDSEDSCNSSVERWALKETDDTSLYSATTATTAYASALESPLNSDASLTPSETSSESLFVLGDDDEEGEEDPSTHVPFSTPLTPTNNHDYKSHCEKTQNILMQSMRFDVSLSSLEAKFNARRCRIHQDHLSRRMYASLTYKDKEKHVRARKQENETIDKTTRAETRSSKAPASVSEETTSTDDTEGGEGVLPRAEEKTRPNASRDVCEKNAEQMTKKIEDAAKSDIEDVDEAVLLPDETTPPAMLAPEASAPKSVFPQEAKSQEESEKSSTDASEETVPPSAPPNRTVPAERSDVEQSLEKTDQQEAESFSQRAPNSDDPSVALPLIQPSLPRPPEEWIRWEEGVQDVDTSAVNIQSPEPFTEPPLPSPPALSQNASADTESFAQKAEETVTQETTVPASSSNSATQSTSPQMPVPPPSTTQEPPAFPQMPVPPPSTPQEPPAVGQESSISGQQQQSTSHEAMPSNALLQMSAELEVPSSCPPPDTLFSLDASQPVKEEEKVALHAARTAMEFEAYHRRIAQQMVHNMGDFANDDNNKQICKEIARNMKLDVSQISSQESQIQTKIDSILHTISQVEGLPGVIYSYVQFAKYLVSKCAGISDLLVFAVAKTAVGVMERHPQILSILLSFLHEVCVLTVPKYYSSEVVHDTLLESLGFRDIPGIHMRKETTDEFIVRQSGYIRFYAAIIELDNKVHGLEYGWSYLSRMLNNLPPSRITASALMNFLSVAGYSLYKKYKRQFYKVLLYIHSRFLVGLATSNNTESQAVYSRLQTYLQNQQFSKPPEAKSMPHVAASFRIHT